jgi:hypothetical protein
MKEKNERKEELKVSTRPKTNPPRLIKQPQGGTKRPRTKEF